MFNVKKNIGRYSLGAFLGLLAGVILFIFQPVQWRGQALVRIGQIQSQSQSQSQNSISIEPITTVVERLKSPSFVQSVAERAKNKEIMALLNFEEKARMTIKPIRGSDSLLIMVTDGSPELVLSATESVVAELISKHNTILSDYQKDAQKELSKLNAEIEILLKQRGMTTGAVAGSNCRPSEGRLVVAELAAITSQRNLEYKWNRTSSLQESISSSNIRPTLLLEPVSLSERRLFSSLWRACLLGGLLGVVFSAIWIRLGKNSAIY